VAPDRNRPPISHICPEGGEQFERPFWPDDPAEQARIEQAAARESMRSDRQSFCGAADGIGSVGFEDEGAYDVTGETRATVFDRGSRPLDDSGYEFRGDRQARDSGAGAGSAGPEQPAAAEDLGGAPAPNVTGTRTGTEAEEMRAQAAKQPGRDGREL
jgi:hypothetical protein